jgi:hypothetical protein
MNEINKQQCPHIHLTKQSGTMDGGSESRRYVCGRPDDDLGQLYNNWHREAEKTGSKDLARCADELWETIGGGGCGESFYVQSGQPTVEMGTPANERVRALTHSVEHLGASCSSLLKRAENAETKLASAIKWLEANQKDVFRRGLWDALEAALSATKEPDRE